MLVNREKVKFVPSFWFLLKFPSRTCLPLLKSFSECTDKTQYWSYFQISYFQCGTLHYELWPKMSAKYCMPCDLLVYGWWKPNTLRNGLQKIVLRVYSGVYAKYSQWFILSLKQIKSYCCSPASKKLSVLSKYKFANIIS